MFTTAAFIFSTTSAKLTTAGPSARPAGRTPSPPRVTPRGAVATIDAGVNSPAMISPTRNATIDESATVTNVKRLDITTLLGASTSRGRVDLAAEPLLHYKGLEFCLGERRDAQVAGFLELGSRVGSDHEIRGFLADGAGYFSTQPFDRGLRFLTRQRVQRSGQHERFPGKP